MLLNADVAVLAIPNVGPGNRVRALAQLASYFSVFVSIGSVLSVLLLLRYHKTKPRDSAEEVVSRHVQSISSLPLYSLHSASL